MPSAPRAGDSPRLLPHGPPPGIQEAPYSGALSGAGGRCGRRHAVAMETRKGPLRTRGVGLPPGALLFLWPLPPPGGGAQGRGSDQPLRIPVVCAGARSSPLSGHWQEDTSLVGLGAGATPAPTSSARGGSPRSSLFWCPEVCGTFTFSCGGSLPPACSSRPSFLQLMDGLLSEQFHLCSQLPSRNWGGEDPVWCLQLPTPLPWVAQCSRGRGLPAAATYGKTAR